MSDYFFLIVWFFLKLALFYLGGYIIVSNLILFFVFRGVPLKEKHKEYFVKFSRLREITLYNKKVIGTIQNGANYFSYDQLSIIGSPFTFSFYKYLLYIDGDPVVGIPFWEKSIIKMYQSRVNKGAVYENKKKIIG